MTKLRYLFLSAHLDDAIISCGDYISKLVQEGNRVTIATVFAGENPFKSLSMLARIIHKKFNLGSEVMSIRRSEDLTAAALLGADCVHLNIPECIYRRNPDFSPSYRKLEELFRADLSLEQPMIEEVIQQLSAAIHLAEYEQIYVPLGIGRHVDHLIVRHAFERWMDTIDYAYLYKIAYYEDLPYKHYQLDVNWKTDLANQFVVTAICLSRVHLIAKIRAIELYKSQQRLLWNSRFSMYKQMLKNTRTSADENYSNKDRKYRFNIYINKRDKIRMKAGEISD
ncbi:PIG-L deacetylase family protein [Paenibacillus puerhi]|uniref:PIG-L deacetylase family protein n=1 Tax=Paenibacillus puerhi TaxID=2692622 RepID=UPI001356745C|nr:PIG-L family deacetylase [Paenibacillus puerhi]